MRKFIILKTYIHEHDVAVVADDVYSIEQEKDVEGRIYTRVKYGQGAWVKVKESVSAVVEKIHNVGNTDGSIARKDVQG